MKVVIKLRAGGDVIGAGGVIDSKGCDSAFVGNEAREGIICASGFVPRQTAARAFERLARLILCVGYLF